MMKLDGAEVEMSGREFTYSIPAPFGPDRGPATLHLTAKPAVSVNASFRAGLDDVMHQAKVKDLMAQEAYDRDKDADAFAHQQAESVKSTHRAIAELNYDNCIINWSTTIQSAGKDIEPTRDNFLSLSAFEHPDIQRLFKAIRRDLTSYEKFSIKAEREVEAEAEKN